MFPVFSVPVSSVVAPESSSFTSSTLPFWGAVWGRLLAVVVGFVISYFFSSAGMFVSDTSSAASAAGVLNQIVPASANIPLIILGRKHVQTQSRPPPPSPLRQPPPLPIDTPTQVKREEGSSFFFLEEYFGRVFSSSNEEVALFRMEKKFGTDPAILSVLQTELRDRVSFLERKFNGSPC